MPVHRLVALLLASSLGAGTVSAQSASPPLPRAFEFDEAHSALSFAVGFMGLSTVRGAFAGVDGMIMYDEKDPSRSSVSLIIDAASINTNARERDTHLRSPDFFDVKKYPSITFRSSTISRATKGFLVKGTLTMHGISRDVEIPMERLHEPTNDAWKNTRVTFHGTLTVSRKDYDIRGTAFWNSEYDPGRMAVSDRVDLDLLVSAENPNPMLWGHPFGDSLLKSIETDGVAQTTQRFRTQYTNNPRIDSIPQFAFLDAGQKLVRTNRVADAITFYETVVDLRPSAVSVRNRLGEAYVAKGDYPQARAAFERVLQDAPTSTRAMEWLRVLPKS